MHGSTFQCFKVNCGPQSFPSRSRNKCVFVRFCSNVIRFLRTCRKFVAIFVKKSGSIFFCFGLKKNPTVVTFQPKITFCQKKFGPSENHFFVFFLVFGFAIPVRARESRPSVTTTNLKTLWSCVERYREKIGRKKYWTDIELFTVRIYWTWRYYQ